MSVRYTNFKGTTLQLPFFFECFACMLVCVPHMYSAREGQMRVFDPLEAGVTHVGHRNQILKKSSQCSKPQNPLSPVLNSNLKLDTFNPSTHEAESSGVWSQPGLPNKLQARHGYIVRPCRGRKKKRERHGGHVPIISVTSKSRRQKIWGCVVSWRPDWWHMSIIPVLEKGRRIRSLLCS